MNPSIKKCPSEIFIPRQVLTEADNIYPPDYPVELKR